MSAATVTLDAVRVWRGGAEGAPRAVLEDISLHVDAGERVALVGPNGAGKTSLLLALVGAVPFEGSIAIAGETLDRRSLPGLRARVGFVFADPTDQLFLTSVSEEVAFGPRQRGRTEPEIAEATGRALAAVELEGFETRRPTELSLGEQRRLTVATALSCEPALMLIDEPTSGLDPVARQRMIHTIRELPATVVMATHDLDAVLDLEARVVLLQTGGVIHTGPAREVMTDEPLLERAGLTLPLGVAARRRAAAPIR